MSRNAPLFRLPIRFAVPFPSSAPTRDRRITQPHIASTAEIAKILGLLQICFLHLSLDRFGVMMTALYRRSALTLTLIAASLAGCQSSPRQTTTHPKVAPAKAAPVETLTETLILPTYPVGSPSDFPEFGRTTGIPRPGRGLYPYTVQRDLSFERRDQGYEIYVLQNEYLRIEVMPTQGGRLFAMYDRSAKQDVVYRQISIKPGLVALRGA